MPNFDGGHYFLTALIPIRTDLMADPRSSEWVASHVHSLREALTGLPTALQSWATENIGLNSPFARDSRTHFARLFVVDDVAFNGRVHRDAIGAAVQGAIGGLIGKRLPGADPTQPGPVDHLPEPYLIFVCEFDAEDGSAKERDAYLEGLFKVMEPEWRDILQHCHGYDRVKDAAGFASLIGACQVETTMPFNDYYVPFPALKGLSLLPIAAPAVIALVLLLVGLVMRLVQGDALWGWLLLVGIIGTPAGIFFAYRSIVSAAQAPLPTGRRTDLVSVMKALYLQQNFIRFAVAQQGKDPQNLHEAFGAFLQQHRPDEPATPTQPRGTVKS
ncbi:MAG: hypothetical protein ACKPAC_09915 [Alphaproteobacteria bacterium]